MIVKASLIFLLPLLLNSGSQAKAKECLPPDLENGIVEAEEGEFGSFLVVKFRCHPGYTLSGSPTTKCRNGVWGSAKPICSVSGCDQNALPTLENGRLMRIKG